MRCRIILLIFSLACLTWQVESFAADGQDYLSESFNHVSHQVMQGSLKSNNAQQSLRDEAIERAATVYGAQSGRYYRWKQIQTLVLRRASLLSRVFNFSALYLDHGLIQPPVLDRSHHIIQVSQHGQFRSMIHSVYRVLIPATFKSSPMVWQSFLLPTNVLQPASPREVLLPRNSQEQLLWMSKMKHGWASGVNAANQEFETRLESLNNTYQGMVLYTVLAMRGMVEPPHITHMDKPVIRSADGKKMAVGVHDQVIAKNSYFVSEPNRWKPIYYDHNFTAEGING